MSKNHLTLSTKTANKAAAKTSKEDQEEDNYDIIDDSNKDESSEDKDDEFIVKMILKPTHNNGIAYIDRPQSSRVQKLLKKASKNKPDKDAVTLTQLVRRKQQETSKKTPQTNEDEMIDPNDALDILNTSDKTDNEENEQEDQEEEEEEDDDDVSDTDDNDRIAMEIYNRKDEESEQLESNRKNRSKPSTGEKFKNTNIFLSAYEGGTRQRVSLHKLLNDVKPKYIILYDCELNFVRQIEVFKAINYTLPLRVYFLMYSNSCEEQRYLTVNL